MPINVIIVDDHPLSIEGIRNILKYYTDITVLGSYTTGTALLEALTKTQPDVLLLDIMIPDISGKELATIITRDYPLVKILTLTSQDAPSHVEGMIRRGSKGYLLKNTDQHTLVKAIRQVYEGQEFIDPAIKEQLVNNILKLKENAPSQEEAPTLTRREKDVLQLIMDEYTSQEIANKLFLSLRTVENHRSNLMEKLDAKNTVSLVKIALRMGLLS